MDRVTVCYSSAATNSDSLWRIFWQYLIEHYTAEVNEDQMTSEDIFKAHDIWNVDSGNG